MARRSKRCEEDIRIRGREVGAEIRSVTAILLVHVCRGLRRWPTRVWDPLNEDAMIPVVQCVRVV